MLPAAPFNGAQSIHVLIYSPNQAYRNTYTGTRDNPALNGQEIAAGEFFIVHAQNLSYAPMRTTVLLPSSAWMG
jgi:hypothetical protein